MAAALALQPLTLDEVIQLEQENDVRYELHFGDIEMMAGGRLNHFRIAKKMGKMLADHFEPKGCEVYLENVKLEAIRKNYYPYPDVMLSCHDFDTKQNNLFVRFPSLVVEVISESTEAKDRGKKLRAYRNMPSIKHYLLVSQYEVLVESYSRIGETDFFKHALFDKMEDEIELEHLDFSFSVGSIYAQIEFEMLPEKPD